MRLRIPHGTPGGVIFAAVLTLIIIKATLLALAIWFVVWVLRVAGVGI